MVGLKRRFFVLFVLHKILVDIWSYRHRLRSFREGEVVYTGCRARPAKQNHLPQTKTKRTNVKKNEDERGTNLRACPARVVTTVWCVSSRDTAWHRVTPYRLTVIHAHSHADSIRLESNQIEPRNALPLTLTVKQSSSSQNRRRLNAENTIALRASSNLTARSRQASFLFVETRTV